MNLTINIDSTCEIPNSAAALQRQRKDSGQEYKNRQMDAGYGWERDTQTVMDASSLVGTRLVRIVTLIRSTPAKRLPRMFLFVITATIHHASVQPLFKGTTANNVADKVQKNRQHRHSVEEKVRRSKRLLKQKWTAKLTADQVAEIRSLAERLSQEDIAKRFDISQGNVSWILRRKTWPDGQPSVTKLSSLQRMPFSSQGRRKVPKS